MSTAPHMYDRKRFNNGVEHSYQILTRQPTMIASKPESKGIDPMKNDKNKNMNDRRQALLLSLQFEVMN